MEIKKGFMCILAAMLGLGLTLGDLSWAAAQEDEKEEFTLEEITVTAQKRKENVQKVPVTMEVISGDKMKELGQRNIDEILSFIGSASIEKAADGLRVSLRGISDNDDAWGDNMHVSTPTVAISTDGVYSSRSDQGQGLYDIERMEVLFGPQSTMYANTSPGGIINVITAAPKTDKFEASGTVEYGNYNYLHLEGSVNTPINEKVALRAAFSKAEHEGYISNGADDEDKKSARLKALFKLNERLSFTLTGEYSFNGGHGFARVEGFVDQDDVDDPWTAADTMLMDPREETRKAGNINLNWDSVIGTLTVIPAYSTTESSDSETMTNQRTGDSTTTLTEREMWEKGADARMVSPTDFFIKWIAGANYNKANEGNYRTVVDSIEGSTVEVRQKSHAFYGNITYPVTDAFRVTAGGRKSWDTMSFFQYDYNQLPRPAREGFVELERSGTYTNNPDGTLDYTEYWQQEYNSMNYKLGVEYDVNTDSMLYADISNSYRMQAMARETTTGESPPPEEMTAYTIGSKNRFFGNKFQVNASAYYYKYKNKVAEGGARVFTNLYEDDPRFIEAGLTAGDGTPGLDINRDGRITHVSVVLQDPTQTTWGDFMSSGIDIMTSWIATGKDRLDFSVSYMHTEWTNLLFDYVYDMVYEDFLYDGKPSILSPKWNLTASYSHNFSLWNGATLTPRLDTRFQSSYVVTYHEREDPQRRQEPYHISNFSMIYASPSDKWTLTGYVKNMENYAVKRNLIGEGESEYFLMIGTPRTYGAILTMQF
ncbi:MAG: TonB-dependent receptor [Deltaproteobacteria bacterium]|nr:TonB-dependent receptor [Deltaproteobacteria bacterium]